MEIHLLDMGTEKYGDCILITKGDKKILIDGAHPGDSDSIRFQLSKLLKQQPPFNFDLLVVTHNHSDHIGCLPPLVQLGDITAETALLIDPLWRWSDDFDDAVGDNLSPDASLAEALDEEDRSDMSDDQLEQFLFDAPRLGPGYQGMIDKLSESCEVILFRGIDDDYSELENKFKDFGMKILGPTKRHLEITQKSLQKSPKKKIVNDFIDGIDTKLSIADSYRQLMASGSSDSEEASPDMMNKGAINSESIVLKFESDGWSALLAGDMQFAKAEVSGLDNEMETLLKTVFDAGPYDFIKTSHHTSYNGLSEEMLDKWIGQNTSLFAHTGGLYDVSHPEPGVLDILKARKNEITFARTDRNGIISVAKENGKLLMAISKGDFNTFTKNKKVNDGVEIPEIQTAPLPAPVFETKQNTPIIEEVHTDGYVEINAKIPHTSTTVKITVEVTPQKKTLVSKVDNNKISEQLTIASKDRFDNLLFMTCSKKLITNIGQLETEKVIAQINAIPGIVFVDIPELESARDATKIMQQKIGSSTKGVVIIGGYDVVPSMQLDVLDAKLREILTQNDEVNDDRDNFIIWSDDVYGDLDGDSLPEIPVSRIPDGKSAQLIFNALNAAPFKLTSKAGIRNIERPFAIDIYKNILSNNTTELEVSEKCTPITVQKENLKGAVYYMLHGTDSDATRFWGERQKGGYCEAMDISNIPLNASGSVVFSGCCWGALTVQPAAYKKTAAISLRPRTVEQSIALTYLNSGALAFIGCTGTHYSPNTPPYNFFGKPMHDAFWKALGRGLQPAEALLEAKKEYARGLPHGLEKPLSKAIEIKILRQFTCLGLGW
jgi:beta-lactamase superfamily II metal-dependent hydrolase